MKLEDGNLKTVHVEFVGGILLMGVLLMGYSGGGRGRGGGGGDEKKKARGG